MEVEEINPSESSAQYCSARMMTSEIVEIGEESRSSFIANSLDGGARDVYVALGKDDLDVLKWALHHLVFPGARVFLVHVCPPVTHIPTPVGRLAKSQLSQDQVRFYMNEVYNRRRNNLQKYIRLCTDAKVTVDTIILENNSTAKAILDLVPILNISNLVLGTKRSPLSRRLTRKPATWEFVKKNAPEYCEVTIIHDGKKITDCEQITERVNSSSLPGSPRPNCVGNPERRFFSWVCFSGKSDKG